MKIHAGALLSGLLVCSCFTDAFAAGLTGRERAILTITIIISGSKANGHYTPLTSVSPYSGSLKECFDSNRYKMSEHYLKLARQAQYESLTVVCVYQHASGELKEYIAGIWTQEGRYEPGRDVKYPEWK